MKKKQTSKKAKTSPLYLHLKVAANLCHSSFAFPTMIIVLQSPINHFTLIFAFLYRGRQTGFFSELLC